MESTKGMLRSIQANNPQGFLVIHLSIFQNVQTQTGQLIEAGSFVCFTHCYILSS